MNYVPPPPVGCGKKCPVQNQLSSTSLATNGSFLIFTLTLVFFGTLAYVFVHEWKEMLGSAKKKK